jgi:hypothetical protein
LNYGRIINNKHTQYARFHELAETYQRTVLEANVEVENAPVAFLKTQQRVRSLKESVEQAKTALERTTEKYVAGAADFNRVFKLQVLLVRQQDQLARSEGGIALNLIAIYKALGAHHDRLERIVDLRLDPRLAGRVDAADVLEAQKRLARYLDEIDREVLILRHFEQLSNDEEPPRLRTMIANLLRDLETIVCKAINKDSNCPYQSAGDLADLTNDSP